MLGNALNGVNTEETGPIDDSRYGNPEEIPRKLIFKDQANFPTCLYWIFFNFVFKAEEKKEISDKVIDALCENNGKF